MWADLHFQLYVNAFTKPESKTEEIFGSISENTHRLEASCSEINVRWRLGHVFWIPCRGQFMTNVMIKGLIVQQVRHRYEERKL